MTLEADSHDQGDEHTVTSEALNYLQQGIYRDLDWERTLDYMQRRYLMPLGAHLDIQALTLADCAAGFGWLSFAWLRSGGGHAVLIEPDPSRLNAARAIAFQLGLEQRCTFVEGYLQNVDLSGHCIDVFATVETLEHVGQRNISACIEKILSLQPRALIVTTPNRRFPVVAHDTRLPFCHWLPKAWRKVYARAFGREKMDESNDFLGASDLSPLSRDYRPVTRYQTFNTYLEFLAFYPHYLPYGPAEERVRHSPSIGLRLFVRLAGGLFGTQAWRVSHNLATIWLRVTRSS